MSLTFLQVKNAKPLAKIIGDGKLHNKVVYIDPNTTEIDEVNNFSKLRIPNNCSFQIIPDTTHERDILYITGASGSGKSTFTRKYVEQYKKKYKDREVYLFSHLKDDPSLDSVKPKRFKMESSLYENPLKVEELADSCVIFDDCECQPDKKIREAVLSIMNQVLEVGRHYNITALITNHLPSDRNNTRRVLNEVMIFTYFPASAGGKIKYVLQNYLDVDEKKIKYFKRINSRWLCIRKHYPQCWISQHELGLLNQDSDDEK
jgi:Cdc6-like AAA superfamily ATPase